MKHIVFFFLLIMSGCSVTGNGLSLEEKNQVDEFVNLIKDGWEIYLLDDKVILTKTENGKVDVKDVFKVLKDD